MTTAPAGSNDDKTVKPITAGLGYGESVLTLSFGDACKVTGMDDNYERSLLMNCSRMIAEHMARTNQGLLPIAGRIEKTPQDNMVGHIVFYRPTPAETLQPVALQAKVNGILQKWTAPQPQP